MSSQKKSKKSQEFQQSQEEFITGSQTAPTKNNNNNNISDIYDRILGSSPSKYSNIDDELNLIQVTRVLAEQFNQNNHNESGRVINAEDKENEISQILNVQGNQYLEFQNEKMKWIYANILKNLSKLQSENNNQTEIISDLKRKNQEQGREVLGYKANLDQLLCENKQMKEENLELQKDLTLSQQQILETRRKNMADKERQKNLEDQINNLEYDKESLYSQIQKLNEEISQQHIESQTSTENLRKIVKEMEEKNLQLQKQIDHLTYNKDKENVNNQSNHSQPEDRSDAMSMISLTGISMINGGKGNHSNVNMSSMSLRAKLASQNLDIEQFIQKFIIKKKARSKNQLEHKFYDEMHKQMDKIKASHQSSEQQLQQVIQQYETQNQENKTLVLATLQQVRGLKVSSELTIQEMEKTQKATQNELDKSQQDLKNCREIAVDQKAKIERLTESNAKKDRTIVTIEAQFSLLKESAQKIEVEMKAVQKQNQVQELKIQELEQSLQMKSENYLSSQQQYSLKESTYMEQFRKLEEKHDYLRQNKEEEELQNKELSITQSKLQEKIAFLSSQLEEKVSLLKESRVQIEQLSKQGQEYATQNALLLEKEGFLKEKNFKMECQLQNLLEENQKLNALNQRLEFEEKSARISLETLQERVDSVNETMKLKLEQLGSKEKIVAKLLQEKQEFEKKYVQMQAEVEHKIQQLKLQADTLKQKEIQEKLLIQSQKRLENDNLLKGNSIQNLEEKAAKYDLLLTEHQQLQVKVPAQQFEIETLADQIKQSKKEKGDLKTQITKLEKEIKAQAERDRSTEVELAEFKKSLKVLEKNRLREIGQKNAELAEQKKQFEDQLELGRKEKEALERELKTKEKQLSLKGEMSHMLEEERTEVEKKIKHIEEQNKKIKILIIEIKQEKQLRKEANERVHQLEEFIFNFIQDNNIIPLQIDNNSGILNNVNNTTFDQNNNNNNNINNNNIYLSDSKKSNINQHFLKELFSKSVKKQ